MPMTISARPTLGQKMQNGPLAPMRPRSFQLFRSIPTVETVNQLLQSGVLPLPLGVLRHRVVKIVHAPQAIDHAGGHRGRASNRAVNAAEVVNRNVDRGRGGQVLDLL